MEEDLGLPRDYFDLVYSIYALGWTVELEKTLTHIHRYLKPGGMFIFSWEHPMHDRIKRVDDSFIFDKSYLQEGPEYNEAWNNTVIIPHRKLSTYINTLVTVGFEIKKVIDDVLLPNVATKGNDHRWYSVDKAKLVPATFIIKARKK